MTGALNGCRFDCCVKYWHNSCPIVTYYSDLFVNQYVSLPTLLMPYVLAVLITDRLAGTLQCILTKLQVHFQVRCVYNSDMCAYVYACIM